MHIHMLLSPGRVVEEVVWSFPRSIPPAINRYDRWGSTPGLCSHGNATLNRVLTILLFSTGWNLNLTLPLAHEVHSITHILNKNIYSVNFSPAIFLLLAYIFKWTQIPMPSVQFCEFWQKFQKGRCNSEQAKALNHWSIDFISEFKGQCVWDTCISIINLENTS